MNTTITQVTLTNNETVDAINAYYAEHKGSGECCVLCGKKMNDKNIQNGFFVHATHTGYFIASNSEVGESQGFFAIGSECAKKLPSNIIRNFK